MTDSLDEYDAEEQKDEIMDLPVNHSLNDNDYDNEYETENQISTIDPILSHVSSYPTLNDDTSEKIHSRSDEDQVEDDLEGIDESPEP